MTILVDTSTFFEYGDDLDPEFSSGGSVSIKCECGFNSWVEADCNGKELFGNCGECDQGFEVRYG